jgi:uncharacterized protein YyaL (SSP411 family)
VPLPQKNLLAEEASPYLRQHADNPVHWRPWSPASLAEARELDRPILLSVGYAACHWCHVMAHESFEDADVAAVMNRLYVNIKVDREERPDIDQIYMAALAATGEQGGWPLTMFLTPDGRPFWGGTYFPKTTNYGRPGFIQVLESVNRAWTEKRAEIDDSANTLNQHVNQRLSSSTPASPVSRESLQRLADGIAGMIDRQLGGLRGAPKFPNAPFMQTLWLSWLIDGAEDHRDAVVHSMEKMLDGGIYDHIGGGLCRYSTDADWLVPHFEKMLYDNAQLIRQAGWAYAATGNELFRIRIEETIAWLLREMRVEGGGFASSLDADSEGDEGLFYVWSEAEIREVLGQAADDFLAIYRLTAPSNWHGKPIVHISAAVPEADRQRLAPMRERLLHAREKRIRPGRDDKVLADWNGLMITALAEAGRQFGKPEWIEAAQAAYRFVSESSDAAGRLPHSILGRRKLFPAMSSDYAAMISAAIALQQATGNRSYLDDATRWAVLLDQWYGGADGHFLTASDSADTPMRIRGDVDEAVPSATSQIVEALFRLAQITGEAAHRDRAWQAAEAAAGRALALPYGQAGIVSACALGLGALKLVTVDDAEHPTFAGLADRYPDPRRVDLKLKVGDSATELPGGTVPDTNRSGAWLCTDRACLPPMFEPEKTEAALRRPVV